MKKIFLSLALIIGGAHAFAQSNDKAINDKIEITKQELQRYSSGEHMYTACVVDAVLMEGLRDSYRAIMAMYDTLQTLPQRIILGEVTPDGIEEFPGDDFRTTFYFQNKVGAEIWITLDATGTMIASKVKTSEIAIENGNLYVSRTGVTVAYETVNTPKYVFICPLVDLLGLIYQCGDGYLVLDIRQPDDDEAGFWSRAFRLEDMSFVPLSQGEPFFDFK